MAEQEIPVTQTALRLRQSMDKLGMSLRDLAKEYNITYEYARRISRGNHLPSKTLLELMSIKFSWNYQEAQKLWVQDQFRLSYGPLGAMAQEFDPEMEEFERGWRYLNPTQKVIMTDQFRLFLSQNRKHIRGGLDQ